MVGGCLVKALPLVEEEEEEDCSCQGLEDCLAKHPSNHLCSNLVQLALALPGGCLVDLGSEVRLCVCVCVCVCVCMRVCVHE